MEKCIHSCDVFDISFFIHLQTMYKIRFGQIYLSKPMMTESDGESATLFPKAARLRNLTYSAPLYVDVSKKAIMKGHDGEEITETENFDKVFIGKVCRMKSLYNKVQVLSSCNQFGMTQISGSYNAAVKLLYTVSEFRKGLD